MPNKPKLKTSEDVKSLLKIESFNDMNKLQIKEFAEIVPQMKKDLVAECMNQIPAKYFAFVTDSIKEVTASIIEDNKRVNKKAIENYQLIIDDIDAQLKERPFMLFGKRNKLIAQKIEVADKIADLDKSNRDFYVKISNNIAKISESLATISAAAYGIAKIIAKDK